MNHDSAMPSTEITCSNMSWSHHLYMTEALREAERALSVGEVPVGCVIVCSIDKEAEEEIQETEETKRWLLGRIVGRGHNLTNARNDPLAHAEFIAAHHFFSTCSAKRHEECTGGTSEDLTLRGCSLYVSVEPCIMCATFLLYQQVSRVYYGCSNPRFGGTGGPLASFDISQMPSLQRPEVSQFLRPYSSIGGIFEEEAIQLLKDFYNQDNENAPVVKRKRKR